MITLMLLDELSIMDTRGEWIMGWKNGKSSTYSIELVINHN